METRSCSANVELVGSSQKCILRGLRTSKDIINWIQDLNIERHHATFRVAHLWKNLATWASQEVYPEVSEKK